MQSATSTPGTSTPGTSRALRAVLAMVLGAALLAACSGGGAGSDTAPARRDPPPAPPPVYVAVGASETVGVGADLPEQAWPEVLRRTRLPEGTLFTNVGISGATVAQALQEELPRALPLNPTLVTVWLNVNDLTAGVPAGTYEAQLRQLVHALRRDGATKVLVANTPPVELLPSYLECRRRPVGGVCAIARLFPPEAVAAQVDTYNAAIQRVAAAEGAIVVDLHGSASRANAAGSFAALVARDGFHPSTLGHRAVADSFGAAL